jgi:uncharacterized delta-60 repeat protein
VKVLNYSPLLVLLMALSSPLHAAIDTDGDGVDDASDAFPFNFEADTDTDGDGKPDVLKPVASNNFATPSSLTWTTGKLGNGQNWKLGQAARTDGTMITSGSVGYASSNWMQMNYTTAKPGTLKFWYRCGGSASRSFLLDGTSMKTCSSGSSTWYPFQTNLTAGPHTFRWEVTAGTAATFDIDDVEIYENSTLTEDDDDDNDGIVDSSDLFPLDPTKAGDGDGDGVEGLVDNCPSNANADQLDTDGDGQGDVCDLDDDNDGVTDQFDYLPLNAAASADSDRDGFPTSWNASCDLACQNNSGLALDNCPSQNNPSQLDTDGDGQGNACDTDDDNDGVADVADRFPLNAAAAKDTDNDGAPDDWNSGCDANCQAASGLVVDDDDDNDGALDVADNCPLYASADQTDDDQDGIGNQCDSDGAGKLDVAFNPGTGANGNVTSAVIQTDGKVLIGGMFTAFNGTAGNRIVRLNSDGSLDASFNTGTGANNLVKSMVLQADGKVLIAGYFTSYNGVAINRIARLNSDGSLDTSFNPGTGASDNVYSVALQSDGKVLIGGSFTMYNGATSNRIARLNSDGSLDTSFNSGTGIDVGAVSAIHVDEKITIGGTFTSYNGTAINRIARLNSDGSLDTGFNPGTGTNDNVESVALQADGKVLIGGLFNTFNGTARNHIARLNSDGSLDPGFNPGVGVDGYVYAISVQADQHILIGGTFLNYNAKAINRIARLNSDGALDTSFNPGTGSNNYVYSITQQADGKVLVGGMFTGYNGTTMNRIARIHTGDADNDGIENAADNCPAVANPDQKDTDGDGQGDACDPTANGDTDNDFIDDALDNCPGVYNPYQQNADNDAQGDACDSTPNGDTDGDGVDNLSDNCLVFFNPDQLNTDGDIDGNACDDDDDNDGVLDRFDAFPLDASESVDSDGDGIGDNADTTPHGDADADGVDDVADNCPAVANANQIDTDGDGKGDVCDNCPDISNADQLDTDGDSQGNACDVFPNDPTLLLQQDGTAKGGQLGGSVAMADMDNDGVVDVLVGSPLANVVRSGSMLKKAGMIQIISGKDNSVLRTISGSAANEQLGVAIAVVADQNKDGVLDVVVGDPLADVTILTPDGFPVLKDAGRVLLYSGSDGRMLRILGEGKNPGDHFGAAVAVGDVNGDSKMDLVVGASRVDASAKDAGQVTVFNGISKKILYQRTGEQAGENFGAAVAVDGNHLFVGAPLHDTETTTDAGRMTIFNSGEGGSSALLIVDGAAKGDRLGSSVSAANNAWAVGAPLADNAGKDAGTVQMFSGLNAMPVKTLVGATAGDNFGSALNMQGDVNKDGKNDIAIGSAKLDVSAAVLLKDAGRVEVLSGAALVGD